MAKGGSQGAVLFGLAEVNGQERWAGRGLPAGAKQKGRQQPAAPQRLGRRFIRVWAHRCARQAMPCCSEQPRPHRTLRDRARQAARQLSQQRGCVSKRNRSPCLTCHPRPARRPQTVVVDCRGHMLGRLASVLAKQLLSGQHIVAVRCEEINISGGMVRQKAKYERFLRKRSVTNPRRGAVKFRCGGEGGEEEAEGLAAPSLQHFWCWQPGWSPPLGAHANLRAAVGCQPVC